MQNINNPQPSPHHLHRRKRNRLILAIAGLLLLLAGLVTAWFLFFQGEKPPQDILKDSLAIKKDTDAKFTVRSQLGFSVTYDTGFLEARGQVTTSAKEGKIEGEEYTGEELKTPRSYNIVTIEAIRESEDEPLFIGRPWLTVSTSAREQYFETRRTRLPGLSDTEITIKEFSPAEPFRLVGREQEIINSTAYEKLLYEHLSTAGTTVFYQLQYVTVQHGRPHVASLYYYPSTKEGDLAPFVQAIGTLSYAAPDSGVQYLTRADTENTEPQPVTLASVRLAAEDTVSTPKDLTEGTDLSIVAKNQLAVVRVGTIYCYDLTLVGTGETPSTALSNVCGPTLGSGSIVRSDGIVCTNGHVVKASIRDALGVKIQMMILGHDRDGITEFVNYLVGIGILRASEGPETIKNLMNGDSGTIKSIPGIIAKVPNSRFKVDSEHGTYAIQLSNEPLRLKVAADNMSFNFSKTIVEADYIDSQVDLAPPANIEFYTKSDVALLDIKADRTFPVVKIGKMGALKKGDQLTLMGFPGFVDGGFSPKDDHTIPTATQGSVTTLVTDAAGNKLVKASAMIAQGNSGGPAFNKAGEQIGLATYVTLSLADPDIGKTKFGKESIMRDVADFVKLAAVHNITFDGTSKVNDSWHEGIEAFSQNDYGKASASFSNLKDLYGDHYLVASFIASAEGQAQKALWRNVIMGAGAVLAILIVWGVIRLIKVLRHPPALPPAPQFTPPPSMPVA